MTSQPDRERSEVAQHATAQHGMAHSSQEDKARTIGWAARQGARQLCTSLNAWRALAQKALVKSDCNTPPSNAHIHAQARAHLTEAVDSECAAPHARQAPKADVLRRCIHNRLVDFIRQHQQARVLCHDSSDGLQSFLWVHSTC